MYSWKDRLVDWANQKGAWTRILMGAGIALVITAIILGVAMPSKGVVDTNTGDIAETKDTVSAMASTLGTKASKAEVDTLSNDVDEALGSQAADISDLDERTRIAEEKLTQARTDITTMQGQIDEALNSPLAATLNGTFGKYTLSVESDEAGNFTARVHLVYSPMVGDAANRTVAVGNFYTGVDWTVNATIPVYVPVAAFDGTVWGITEVWWSTGTFELAAKSEKDIDITCAGLNSTWEPDYAYVEVWPALK